MTLFDSFYRVFRKKVPAAPIALFAFARPDHLRRTIENLQNNKLAEQSKLYVFCDGPRSEKDVENVEAVRKIVDNIDGFKKVVVAKQTYNIGLAQSVISGVTTVLRSHDRLIVVEDDLITSKYFLNYMNDGLNIYKNELRVASIHGYTYPIEPLDEPTFFLRGADCWGWGTWRRAWDKFEPNPQILLERIYALDLEKKFDLDDRFGFTQMLQDFADNKINSWAIRWHASAFLENMLTLYPSQSLVHNIGNDSSGTHGAASSNYNVEMIKHAVQVNKIVCEENVIARERVAEFFRQMQSN